MGNSQDQKLDSWWGWKSQGSLTLYLAAGTTCAVPLFSFILQMTYVVRALLQQSSVEADIYWDLNLECTASLLVASLLLQSICLCTSQSQSVSERRKTVPLGRMGSFHQVTRSRTGDVRIRRGVRWCYILGRYRLTDSVLRHNGSSLALEYQSKLIMRAMVQSIFIEKCQKKATYSITALFHYIVKSCVSPYLSAHGG